MKITILGAGVIGVSAAYSLASRGHEVEVLDRAEAAGMETSYSNGGQLSFSHAEPWANPQVFKHVFGWMFKKDAPLVLKLSPDPHMMSWTLAFLRNCSAARSKANAVNLLRLGLYSKQEIEKVRLATNIKFDNLRTGILHTYTNEKDLAHAIQQAEFQNKSAGAAHSMEVLTREEILRKEPMLARAKSDIRGGIFCAIDESGDVHSFTQNLATYCTENLGVKFHYGVDIERIIEDGKRVTGVRTNKGIFSADSYVMAMGSYSYKALRRIGIRVPIYPLKGYSVTVPVGQYAPHLSITDNEHKVVITRLGDRLRAAGTAEFAGYNTDLREIRIRPIVACMKNLFPDADYREETMEKWACLRPATPDGLPIIGETKYSNFYLNTGHGTLGWTQASGSATLLADIMERRATDISLAGLTLERL